MKALMRGNFVMCPTLCFRKSVLGSERFAEEWRQVQDLEFTTRLLMAGREIVGSRRAAYAYRRHPESATEIEKTGERTISPPPSVTPNATAHWCKPL